MVDAGCKTGLARCEEIVRAWSEDGVMPPSSCDARARRREPSSIAFNHNASYFVASDVLWMLEAREAMRAVERSGRRLEDTPLAALDDLSFKHFKFWRSCSHDIPIVHLDLQSIMIVIDMMMWKIFGNVDCDENRFHPQWVVDAVNMLGACRLKARAMWWYLQSPEMIGEDTEFFGTKLDDKRAVVSMNFVFDFRNYADEIECEIADDSDPMRRRAILTSDERMRLLEMSRRVYSRYVALLDMDALLDKYKTFVSERVCTDADVFVYARRMKRDPYSGLHKRDDVVFKKNEVTLEKVNSAELLRVYLQRLANVDFVFPLDRTEEEKDERKKSILENSLNDSTDLADWRIPNRHRWFDDYLFELALLDVSRLTQKPIPNTWKRSRLYDGFISKNGNQSIVFSTLSELLVHENSFNPDDMERNVHD